MFQTAMLLLLIHIVFSFPEYIDLIPNGRNVPDHLGVGHISSDPRKDNIKKRNQFGLDFHRGGKSWTLNLCRMDSDGDSKTNGQELGDPDCVWKVGAVPSRIIDITDPSIPEEL